MPIAKFIPNRRAERISYLRQLADILVADFAAYGILTGDATAFDALVTTLETDSAALDAANLARKAATSAISDVGGSEDIAVTAARALTNAMRADSDVTDEDLANIGVSRRDPNATPIGAPSVAPEFNIAGIGQGHVDVTFRTAGSANPRARLPQTAGVQIAVVDGVAGASAGEADRARREFASRTPFQLDTSDYPTVVRLYARWQTAKGLTGPWSDPVTFRPQL